MSDPRTVALTEQLGAQLHKMGASGVKITQLLSMVQFERPAPDGATPRALGTLAQERKPLAWRDVQRVVEKEHDAKLKDTFSEFEQKPFAGSSLGQVHRAQTADGEQVAVKVQHPDVNAAITDELRNIGIVSPIIKLLAPGSDAAGLLGEVRERVADELDYETEAQNQRRLSRLYRNHPHVRIPAVHTNLSTRRVLVSEYVEGKRIEQIAGLPEAQRDRIGEIACRFYFGLIWREQVVAGDPHPENLLLCPDGRVCLLDFGLQRKLDVAYLDGERRVLQAITGADPVAVHEALSDLGYLSKEEAYDADRLLAHLGTASEWFLGAGPRRIDPAYVAQTLEVGYPPRSQWFPVMQRMNLPPSTLLLRRAEVQLLSLLGALNAAGDWPAIAAEHWSGTSATTPLGVEDNAFFKKR